MRGILLLWLATACGASDANAPRDAARSSDASPADGTAAVDAYSSVDAASSTLPASDEFSGSTLDPSWTVLDASKLTVVVGGGTLQLTPASSALWYNANRGGLVYKTVTGDFTATATVHARKSSNASAPPDLPVELGGVMARAPDGTSENYVFIVVGYAEQNQLAVEHKSTTSSVSVYSEIAFGADAELRLCRQGATFTMYRRVPGATTWTQQHQVTRSDLPAALQVGPNAYTLQAAPDVTIRFDQFTFADLVGGACI